MRVSIAVLAVAWASVASAVSTEPENLKDLASFDVADFYSSAQVLQGAAYLSIGYAGNDRILTYTDLQTHEVMWIDMRNPGAPQRFELPGFSTLHLSACLWGEGVVFCETETNQSGRWEDAIVTYDYDAKRGDLFVLQGRYLAQGPNGERRGLKYAYGNLAVIEEANRSISLITWDGNTLSEDPLPASGSMPHSPVIGTSGGDFPGAPIYVVFQDRDPNGFILKAWDTVQKQLVAERAVGFIEPRPSDLYGFALIEGDNPTTIQLWDPTEPPENPDGPPNRPKPVIGTPLTPSFHDCDSLHEARIGPFFALVRGENCGPAPYGPKLFLVTTDRNWFVWDSRAGVYQPFLIDSSHEISTEQPFQYVVYGDHFAYYDVNSHEVQIVEVNTYDRIMPIDARWSPDPNNNYFPVPLAPWNVGSWGEGEIDFARGDRDHYWDVFLSNKQTYRIFVYTRDHAKCQEGGWPYHARLKVEGSKSNFFQEVDSHPFPDSDVPDTCPGIQVSPKEYEVFNVRVDRPVTGYPGAEPPLRYYIHIEVQ